MHPAWQVDDVWRIVRQDLEPRSLARLAQTCRSFFEVATNELWRTIYSVKPFLCCLPPDHRERPLRKEDIERLDFYAKKVLKIFIQSASRGSMIPLPRSFNPAKHYTYKYSDDGKDWEELWTEIAKLRPVSEFLPNLQDFQVSGIDEELLIPFVGISGSNVTNIRIQYVHYRYSESLTRRFLDQLQDTSKLKYLLVRDGESHLIPSKVIQESPLVHLRLDPRNYRGKQRFIEKGPIQTEVLQKSSLEHLTIGLTDKWYSADVRALTSKYLPALTTLRLDLINFERGKCCREYVESTTAGWTSAHMGQFSYPNDGNAVDCWKRSPTVFLTGLDNPELELLNIKFNINTTGRMFLEVITAAYKSCRLEKLSELAFTGGGWWQLCGCCDERIAPLIASYELRSALKMILPLPRLKVLQLSVAPNFLDVLDLNLYRSITSGIPILETLHLSHKEFASSLLHRSTIYHEMIPLHHLAAFCSMLPMLKEVSLANANAVDLETTPTVEWTCLQVTSLNIGIWARPAGRGRVSSTHLNDNLRAYFPNTDLGREGVPLTHSMFE